MDVIQTFGSGEAATFFDLGVFSAVVGATLLFLGIWFLLQLFLGSQSVVAPEQGGGVAFFAHVGGFVFGLLAIRIFSVGRPRPVRPTY